MAYGWVEICSDVAGCGRIFHKISDFLHFSPAILISVDEIDEHVNECMYE